MTILPRYILREHVGPLLFSLSALTALLLLNQVAKQFGNLVGKGLPWSVIGEFFLLSIPFIVAMTLPMAVLVSVLYAFSRLAAENEITALRASGVGMWRMVMPVLWGAAFLSLLMLAFNDQVLPRSNHRLRTLQTDIARKKPTFALREQVINEVSPGRLFLKTGRIDESSDRLREITIYDLSEPTRRRTIYADSGRMALSPQGSDLQMTLYNGYSQEIPREQPGQLQRLFFDVDHIRVRGVANQLERTGEDGFRGEREMSICEMQREYRDGEAAYESARRDLREALAEAAREGATGVPATPAGRGIPDGLVNASARQGAAADSQRAARPRRVPEGGLADLYCEVLLPALGVGTAIASPPPEPLAPVVPSTPQLPASRPSERGDLVLRTQPADSAGAARGKAGAAGRALQLGGSSRGNILPNQGARAYAAVDAGGAQTLRPLSTTVAQLDLLRNRILDSRQTMSRFEVEIHKKFALAAACVVFVILGVPIALRFPRGGVGLVIGVSFVVFALYYVGLIAGESLADRLIVTPFWSMWLANVLFTAVGVVLYLHVRKEGGTTRGGDTAELLENIRIWVLRRLYRLGVLPERRKGAAT